MRVPPVTAPGGTDSAFIQTLKDAKPSLEAEQRQGRALLWDKRLDRQAAADDQDSRVPQQPYVYQTKQR